MCLYMFDPLVLSATWNHNHVRMRDEQDRMEFLSDYFAFVLFTIYP